MDFMEEGFVESQGIRLHYIANKADETKKITILFVPGLMMPAWIWEKQLEYFSEDYRVVALDIRSQGDSEQATEGHYASSIAKDIQALINELHLQNIVLVGWSLSAPEVVNYAANFGSKELIGLVLVDGLVGIDPSLPFYQATVNYWDDLQRDRVQKTKEFVQVIFKQPQSEAYLERLLAAALRTPTNTVMTFVNNYILQDFRGLLPKINIPTLIAVTEGPRLEYMKKLPDLLPNAKLEIFNTGHALFVDDPKRFNQLLESFIKNITD